MAHLPKSNPAFSSHRHSELLGQKTGLEQREEALRGQKERLEEAERQHRELSALHGHLKEEHER